LIELLGRQGRISANDAAGLLHGLRREGRLIEEVY
jgi:sulfite reductase alpha subunit-like flavoprotein